MRHLILLIILAVPLVSGCTTARVAPRAEACPELASLTPAARGEVLALARILALKPRLAVDFSRVGMHALSVGHDTMVTFAADPNTTKEDIILFVPAKRLIRAGLDTSKFEPVPARDQMESGKWYFSAGRDPEPRFNNNAIGTPVLMMAIDTEAQ